MVNQLKILTCIFLIINFKNSKMTDLQIIKQIEKQLNIKLKKVEVSKMNQNSFVIDNGVVTHLDLSWNNISDISFLKDLKNLTELDLSGNEILDILFL